MTVKAKTQNRATVIRTDGTEYDVGHQPKIEEAQDIVGGWVEMMRVGANQVLVMDEEGRIKQKPVNKTASSRFGFMIVGNVIVLEGWCTLR